MGVNHANIHLARIFKKAGGPLPVVILQESLPERTALEYECALIAANGRTINGGPLANLTDGGDGISGFVFSEESIAKIKLARRNFRHSAETKAKMSLARKGKKFSKEHREKLAEINRLRARSVEGRLQRSNQQKLHFEKPGVREKASRATQSWHSQQTPEQKADRSRKISEATKAAMARPDVRERFMISISGKRSK